MEYVETKFPSRFKILIRTIFHVLSMKDNVNVSETVNEKRDYPFIKLMYATNDRNIAKIAEDNGVDWIWIDLEIIGKEERQGHLDTRISHHNIEDIKKIREVIKKAKIIVRVNPP